MNFNIRSVNDVWYRSSVILRSLYRRFETTYRSHL